MWCSFSTGSFDTLITQPKAAGIDPHQRWVGGCGLPVCLPCTTVAGRTLWAACLPALRSSGGWDAAAAACYAAQPHTSI